jgi:hypothetical protein
MRHATWKVRNEQQSGRVGQLMAARGIHWLTIVLVVQKGSVPNLLRAQSRRAIVLPLAALSFSSHGKRWHWTGVTPFWFPSTSRIQWDRLTEANGRGMTNQLADICPLWHRVPSRGREQSSQCTRKAITAGNR